MAGPIWQWSALDTATAIRERRATAEEVVAAHVDRMRAVNPPLFKDNIAPGDSPVVANLKKAGAIIIGMTNTPEFSMRGFTDNKLHGLTSNPWDSTITCGGSSGGAGPSIDSHRPGRYRPLHSIIRQ